MSYSMAETEALFGQMLDGQMVDDAIADLLVEMADRGETAEEVAGAVRAMRARMLTVAAPDNAIDVCGTGGDGQHSLNVSTAVALVVAACGVPVAKHGNRAASSKAGGADTLETLGLDLARAGHQAEATLPDLGIAFLFAQAHHPALARIAPIRKALGRRTIFNLTGPLANPASVRHQLVGVAHPDIVPLYAEAMRLLGTDRALVVSGMEGLDELSIAGPSRVEGVGFDAPAELVPEDAGLARHPLDTIKGGDPDYNALALRRLLQGESGAYRDAVVLNAAAALWVAGEADNLPAGAEEAAEAIDKGLANALLNCWIDTVKA
ncbi:anthranilate phosphoribosyltransferase [Croceicoccus naphthovorans]|uniref:Anthranilate phosphoribosyltransferase n=1 Tax=Croceicoccus naphthovorans TaxID=1348774 RepID=A0A0G3XHT6_9SPHN|nr:anthranilate phosphoribosyltransferase [Croceicoccus naphthovorans]AKM09963.1 anthranilate phosphoribosyltransferase [Croceicoccus naphthovorans]MBB3990871.1 anthranilate phosphoribosyltransferase [Croceicoccus naphthovorans]